MYHLEFDELALNDLREAVLWYEEQQEQLGKRLLIEVRSAVNRIVINPHIYPKVKKEFRQAKISVFPYVFIFEIFNDRVIIYRFFHTSRNPGEKFRKS